MFIFLHTTLALKCFYNNNNLFFRNQANIDSYLNSVLNVLKTDQRTGKFRWLLLYFQAYN